MPDYFASNKNKDAGVNVYLARGTLVINNTLAARTSGLDICDDNEERNGTSTNFSALTRPLMLKEGNNVLLLDHETRETLADLFSAAFCGEFSIGDGLQINLHAVIAPLL